MTEHSEELIALFKKESYKKDLTKAKILKKNGSLTFVENPSWINDPNDKGWRPEDCNSRCFLYENDLGNPFPFAAFCDKGFYKIEFSVDYPGGKGTLLASYK